MRIALLFLSLLLCTIGYAQEGVLGKWKTIDDETNKPRSIVELYEKDGLVYGKIIKLFQKAGEDPDPLCDECSPDDPRYKKKIIGMEIMKGMKKAGEEYEEGSILDPNNGKVYTCKAWVEDGNLKIRGYWGPFYRTQTWLRAQ
jgi:uncharacterized protein (DUF2147 family)